MHRALTDQNVFATVLGKSISLSAHEIPSEVLLFTRIYSDARRLRVQNGILHNLSRGTSLTIILFDLKQLPLHPLQHIQFGTSAGKTNSNTAMNIAGNESVT